MGNQTTHNVFGADRTLKAPNITPHELRRFDILSPTETFLDRANPVEVALHSTGAVPCRLCLGFQRAVKPVSPDERLTEIAYFPLSPTDADLA